MPTATVVGTKIAKKERNGFGYARGKEENQNSGVKPGGRFTGNVKSKRLVLLFSCLHLGLALGRCSQKPATKNNGRWENGAYPKKTVDSWKGGGFVRTGK